MDEAVKHCKRQNDVEQHVTLTHHKSLQYCPLFSYCPSPTSEK